MELPQIAQQDPPDPQQTPDSQYISEMLIIANDVEASCGLAGLEFQVSCALREGGPRTRARAAREALEALRALNVQSAPGLDRRALESALERVLAALTSNGYVDWADHIEGLSCDGKTFAYYATPHGPAWAILDFMDRLCRGQGYAARDGMRNQREWLHIDSRKLAARKRARGAQGTSARAIEGWRPYLVRLGLLESMSGAHNRKEYRPTWWGADAQTAAAIFQEALRRLVEDERAGRLPPGRSGRRNARPTKSEAQAPKSEPVRNSCETGAKLKSAQPNVKTGCCDEIRADTDTDYIRDCSLGVSTTQEVVRTSGGLVRGSGGSGHGSGSRLPPDASLPAYVGALVSVLGEGRRSTVEKLARVMFAAHGEEAVAPIFKEAAHQDWAGALEAVSWIKDQVAAAVARGDIPEAGILDPPAPAAAALKNRARG